MPPSQQDPGEVSGRPDGVVCGVDGSQPAADAAWAAARAAGRWGLGLQLVRAFDWPEAGVPGLPAGDAGRAAARHSALGQLFRLADGLAAVHPGSSVAGVLTDGTAPEVLTAATAHASLLVVGARGHSWRDGPRTGSVAVGVARTTQCPLLVHRAPEPGEQPRAGVVVGVDGGPTTVELLAVAARAAGEDGRLTVVRKGLGGPARGGSSATLDATLDALHRDHPGLLLDLRSHDGPPGALLVELSATASLVVVGRPADGSRLLPERAGAVLRRSRCSTLVVPLDTRPGVGQPLRAQDVPTPAGWSEVIGSAGVG